MTNTNNRAQGADIFTVTVEGTVVSSGTTHVTSARAHVKAVYFGDDIDEAVYFGDNLAEASSEGAARYWARFANIACGTVSFDFVCRYGARHGEYTPVAWYILHEDGRIQRGANKDDEVVLPADKIIHTAD